MKTRRRSYPSPRSSPSPSPAIRTDPKKYPIPAPPFRFQGDRRRFLECRVPLFVKSPLSTRREFWKLVFAEYWALFPWRLAIDVDRHDAMNFAEPEDHLECDLKVATMLTTEARIKSFFYHARWMLKHNNHGRTALPTPAQST
ncbi:hypothetical protein B0H13DRAFT_2320390 [Mycena leptocephala]|nr:hypothetical protein B0H13DRAFT_2320390 [Mycena leptocephala]